MADSSPVAAEREPVPAGEEDHHLVERLARGDGSAFDRLVETHRDRVARLSHRLLAWPEDVDDVVQEVFLAAFKALPRFRGQSSLATWLTRITVNACRRHRRRRLLGWRLLVGVRGRASAKSAEPAESSSMSRERFEQVRDAVRGLPARYREVVVLRYLEQMPADAVGEVLGISRSNVEVRLHRARARLKERLAGLTEG